MTYQIISDSTCDLSPEQVKKYNIHLMPLYVQLGDKTFRDGVDIHPDDIYAHVAAGGDLAATAAVNLADYVQVFSEYSRKADFVIHVTISSDFSCCYQNACLAAQEFDNVYVVDSENLSSGQGLLVVAAAKLAGVRTVVRAGGAQAIAALAFGTQTVPKVDKIVGPGNIYVATAKQLCYARGPCDIDMIAGPSEIMIISDANSNPVHLAADLLSQAEHDRLSSAGLAVTDASLARKVAAEVERQLKLLPREEIARTSIEQNGRILVVDSLETAARLADEIAPEHLELCVDDPFGLLPMVHNAGSVFVGRSCPEPLGDYLAGPNHTLPTSGTARYSSPLGVDDFCRRSSYLYYTPAALEKVSEDVMRFARREGLDAHANAVAVRMEGRS